jgi:putative acetyltransferase
MHIDIVEDDLRDGSVIQLLQTHLKEMHQYSPIESIHAINPEQLKDTTMTFWSARVDGRIAGCVGLKALSGDSGEIKSMKTHHHFLRLGVAEKLLLTIMEEALKRSYKTLSLETGSHSAFQPAIKLYKKHGFIECGPFCDYVADPHSRFYTKRLG